MKTEIIHYLQIDSTNSEAKRLIENGKSESFAVTADCQTKGRGRRGKSFYSPEGTGLYMSLALKSDSEYSDVASTSSLAAVAVCRAIESLTDKKPKIKWVNDIYLDGRKICGILCETVTDFNTGRVRFVIIGIGINISTKRFPEDIENAGCLGAEVDKTELEAEIINELTALFKTDFSAVREYYKSRSMLLGKQISYTENGAVHQATAVDIDGAGGLVIQSENGEIKTLTGGEVSVRI